MVSKAQQMTKKLHAYLRLEDLKLLFQQWQRLLLEVLCTVFKVLLSCTTIINRSTCASKITWYLK